jgi:hybrid cluster-associated redox disulfide protein
MSWPELYINIGHQESEEMDMERQVTKETLIGDLLQMEPETAQFLIQMGMHCLGCPASRAESLEEACMVHGVDADEMVERINKFLEK